MVGIVIVSHSIKVSEGIKEIATQMAAPNQKIVSAGGLDSGELGTDALKISQAIIEANTGEGVLVFVDLGSSILSTNMAIELLDKEISNITKIADAPILEGTIIGAIEASCGSDINEVLEAAQSTRNVLKL